MRLFEISHAYETLLMGIDEMTEEEFAEQLEAIAGALEEKADNTALVYKTLTAEAEALKAEEEKLKMRRQAKEKRAESLKEYLSRCLLAADKTKLETERNVISFRKSQSVYIADEESFCGRGEYVTEKITRAPDKKAILEDLKEGVVIEGAILHEKMNIQIK